MPQKVMHARTAAMMVAMMPSIIRRTPTQAC